MNRLIQFTANFIITFGFLIVLGGIFLAFRLNNLMTQFPVLLIDKFTPYIPSVAGAAIVLNGLLTMAVGEFLYLMIGISESLSKIAETPEVSSKLKK